ncbi:MAG: 1-acyl-sn-glycerol-3-phosphate acyltransferase [Polyangiaceae bacterium]|nr:1-acyl-sn-glycerol-3-phosphate acyltransferase [Polyangiaceae bacterium]
MSAAPDPRPNLLERERGGRLSRVERIQVRLIRRITEPGWFDSGRRWLQRNGSQRWIHALIKNLLTEFGTERLPEFDPNKSYIIAANHLSIFDLYAATSQLMRRGLPHRVFFPVKSEFFYDTPAGFVVNALMSGCAMYPPIFRQRERAALNIGSLDELAWLLRQGGTMVGIHPEGQRSTSGDPYQLLESQSGVGRLARQSGAIVIPVFINGLVNDLSHQVKSNFTNSGTPIHLVFGKPVELDELMQKAPSPKLYREITARVMAAIQDLAFEERDYRDQLPN